MSTDANHSPALLRVALIGNPNTGKTTLFNRLCGLRHKTSNFPGTTQEARVGTLTRRARPTATSDASAARPLGGGGAGATATLNHADSATTLELDATIELIDMPGIYSLELDQSEAEVCRQVLAGTLALKGEATVPPDAVCVVLDSTNLARNLLLAGETLRRRLPTLVLANMADLARAQGLHVDVAALSTQLGCEVIAISARSGEGCADIADSIARARIPNRTPPGTQDGLEAWAEQIYLASAISAGPRASHTNPATSARRTLTDRLDRIFTHPVLGLVSFALIMSVLFWTIFRLATFPMEWIDGVFNWAGAWLEGAMSPGILRDFLAQGVVIGIGATVVFLPQICLLFFLISVLEDTGYLARAAFVMDRVLKPFGLPGHSFVPLLSSHACALPGIMACRGIPDRRQRLATILVAPFMTCSARIPVYALVTGILFAGRPALAALAFVGAYALGALAGLGSAMLARSTILRGVSRPMILELPTYKAPSIRTALLTTYDRAITFIKNAGTNILAISILLWWLGAYPHVEPPPRVEELRSVASAMPDAATRIINSTPLTRADIEQEADHLEASHAKAHSFIGRLGRTLQPAFAPLGYDWKLTVGVLTSFAAREVFASTMGVVVAGSEDFEDQGVRDTIAHAERDDGTPIFTHATSWSILVFFVLAMQCLPTLVVTARETGHVKWALLQLGWMTLVAYIAATVTYQSLRAFGMA